jgi:hypothetical protein
MKARGQLKEEGLVVVPDAYSLNQQLEAKLNSTKQELEKWKGVIG